MRIIICICLISISLFANEQIEHKVNKIVEQLSNANINPTVLSNINYFIDNYITWKIEENEKGYMMTVDFPYQDILNPVDYLSLTIVKFKNSLQPRIFSIACSSIINPKKGMSIYFGKRVSSDSQRIALSKTKLINIKFTEIHPDYLKTSFEYMKYKEINLLELRLNNDHMFIEFYSQQNNKYSIAYPLFKFKEQYSKLE